LTCWRARQLVKGWHLYRALPGASPTASPELVWGDRLGLTFSSGPLTRRTDSGYACKAPTSSVCAARASWAAPLAEQLLGRRGPLVP
jgi:hypothetical protein